jgi:hypothetical protein
MTWASLPLVFTAPSCSPQALADFIELEGKRLARVRTTRAGPEPEFTGSRPAFMAVSLSAMDATIPSANEAFAKCRQWFLCRISNIGSVHDGRAVKPVPREEATRRRAFSGTHRPRSV